jgi:cell wall-associated NlpC family hydrolase
MFLHPAPPQFFAPLPRPWRLALAAAAALFLVGCASAPPVTTPPSSRTATKPPTVTRATAPRPDSHQAVMWAMAFLGVPYQPGGNTPEQGFDCSGFTRHVFAHSLGISLPRRAEQQAQNADLPEVARDDLLPGDLVFFNTQKRPYSHVGIFVGQGRFVHSPREGAAIRIDDMRLPYWESRFEGGRRAPLP